MELWQQIADELSAQSDTQLRRAVFDKVSFKEVRNGQIIVLSAPDDIISGWFAEHFVPLAQDISARIAGHPYQFLVEVQPLPAPTPTSNEPAGPYAKRLNPRYTLDLFVVGPSNDFAHAAALNVAAQPGLSYNPLFVYGSPALGKTHLIQGIAHEILRREPQKRVLYVTSEAFTNDFVTAIQNKNSSSFRDKYRSVDILLIDDIQFFENKESTLEELFHTFNTLLQNQRQMIFACDRAPKQLFTVEERLRTRFESGLVVDIKAPDLEMRKAILLQKADQDQFHIPDSVIDYIAENLAGDVRLLEGSLTKLIAFSQLKKKDISLNLTKEILRDVIKVEDPKDITISEIQRVTTKYFDLTLADLRSTKRHSNITHPRQVAMYIATKYTNMTLSEIGEFFNGKAHTTVMRSAQKVERLVHTRKRIKKEVEDILALLQDAKSAPSGRT